MKTKLYEERLYAFARHIEKLKWRPLFGTFKNIHIDIMIDGIPFHGIVKVPCWLFDELVECFPNEWVKGIGGREPFWNMYPEFEVIHNMTYFFGINEFLLFCHFFDALGFQQIEIWGGKQLTKRSYGKDISLNIIEYLRLNQKAA